MKQNLTTLFNITLIAKVLTTSAIALILISPLVISVPHSPSDLHTQAVKTVDFLTKQSLYSELQMDMEIKYEDHKITAEDDWDRDFSRSVDIDGDVLIVGDPEDDEKGNAAGAAYIFRYDGEEWVKEQKIFEKERSINQHNHFGAAVAIQDDLAVIGSPGVEGDCGYDEDTGAAYVYCFNGESWFYKQTLVASEGADYQYIGSAVAIDGDHIIVGGPGPMGSNELAGLAFIFHHEEQGWIQKVKLWDEFGGNPGDQFGAAIDIKDDVAIVGVPNDDTTIEDAGAVFIYRYDGDSWNKDIKALASDGETNDRFGTSVTIKGDTAVIGAPYDDDNGLSSGSAYHFHYNADDATWSERQKLIPLENGAGDSFGCAVSLDDDTLLIGAKGFDTEYITDHGCTYVYYNIENQWSVTKKLLASDYTLYLGRSLGFDGTTILAGSGADPPSNKKAYIFVLIQGDIDGDGDIDTEDLLALLGAWGEPGGPADLNYDGIVNTEDLLILLGNWG
jgi:hypothetical protein